MKIKICLLIAGVILAISAFPQESSLKFEKCKYHLESVFTGKINSDRDSIYKVYCVFEGLDLNELATVEVRSKLKDRQDISTKRNIKADDAALQKRNNKVFLDLGVLSKENNSWEILLFDKEQKSVNLTTKLFNH